MACVPILGRRKQYRFEAVVRLHSLVSVPYVNAVTFAKLRLVNSRHSSQYSPRVEIRHHTVTWNTEHRFMCRFRTNTETTVLEPNILKISIRMETKGGKSFCKVGFVSVDLACFTALGNVISRRRYILEGYDEKHKRLDNSLLLVSFSMRQLFGDTCFRPPPENLSNCLIEPPDSDEGDSALIDAERNVASTALREPSVCDPNIPTHPTDRPSSIDRILADAYSIQPSRVCSTQSPVLTGLSTQAACDRLQSILRGQQNSSTLSPEQLTRLLDQIIVPGPQTELTVEPTIQSRLFRPPESVRVNHLSHDFISSDNYRYSGCPVSPTDGHPLPSVSPESHETRTGNISLEEHSPRLPAIGMLSHSSSSATPTSISTTPGSTPTDSPARCPLGESHHPSCSKAKLDSVEINVALRPDCGDALVLDLFDSVQCHSLPHHASLQQPYGRVQDGKPKLPQHFATDSGLLMPSRRRKVRPAAADLVFPSQSLESGSMSPGNANIPRRTQRITTLLTTTSVASSPSTGGESHSSGYQSHSRQSSLESQPVTGANLSPILSIASGCSATISGSNPIIKPEKPSSTITSPPS